MIANTPKPPYYAVIFTNLQTTDLKGYGEMAEKMQQLAACRDGFLGIESAREGLGITVSYWRDEASILAWKADVEHQIAQKLGKEKRYASYKTRVCKVERDYGFPVA
ncbi:MAG: antibiotic biosynthesis monooxygenase [Gammaproteobacteria bacterium]|nr:antibiotic biosynthesis monooxygenase [Gammaproteobacteria bacterium]